MPILSLQNGLGNLDKIIQIIGPKWAMAGRVIFGAEIASPGRVSVTVYAEEVIVGGIENGIDYQRSNGDRGHVEQCRNPHASHARD